MNKTSVKITAILIKVLFVLLCVAAFLIPSYVQYYDTLSTQASVAVPLMVGLYVTLVPAFIVVIHLGMILSGVRANRIFTRQTVNSLRIMAYCCFAVSVVWLGLSFVRTLSIFICVAAVFMGLVLRVLKNVFEQANLMKEENDYTI